MSLFTVVFVAAGLGIWLASFVLEALRSVPQPPRTLRWATDIPIDYVKNGANGRLRYIKAGRGPNLVLLHTLRTQLDLFQKVVPDLTKQFTVYALDYPGHGFSDIPKAEYDADFFAHAVEGFLDALDLRDVTLCGVSIGGAICLILAGRHNARVRRVVAINPYDYAKGRSMTRSSPLGWMIMTTSSIPIVGETVMRLRNFIIMKAVLRGGVANPESIPRDLLKEMYEVGNRPGHYRAFISLLRNAPSWEAATKVYQNISVPVRLVWGDKDWAHPTEREHHSKLIPKAETVTIKNAGHFLPLDTPNAVVEEIKRLTGVGSSRVSPQVARL
ncbi:MAG TPA: alpha/beta hydrolase [Candidatus Acidoferrum sp.]|nr:alpha/beta hydrolase [Candidatus Acidoferrum sp.]